MKVLKLDTHEVVDLPVIEAISMIDARVAVEAPESAMLDRAQQTAARPVPAPAPQPQKRTKKRKR